MHTSVSDTNSAKFRFWSFVSMLLLVFVHGYNLNIRYLHPFTMPEESMTFTAFTEYLLANGLLRFRIPMLFLISGFLFALHDERTSHLQRMRKRVRTLLLPMLLWSAFALLLAAALQQIPFWKDIIASTNLVRLNETRDGLFDHSIGEILTLLTFATPAYQFWFIRSLFIYNLMYPLILRAVLHPKGQKFFFGFAILLWLSGGNIIFIEGEGLLFFSLGIWIQKRGFEMDQKKPWMSLQSWFFMFIGIAIIKTLIAFHGQPYLGLATEPILLLLHKMVVFSGLVFAWYSSTALAQRWMQRKWFAEISAFSFVIYAAHAPFVAFAVEVLLRLGGGQPFTRLTGFFLLPTLLIAACIAFGWLLRQFLPKIYTLMTGGRGLV